ncbi:hypothetical protein BDR07DRAFT_1420331 [Suillus spraguei]|nr:hypothetical protein BDR07DRAFT_1420331 [Suillus spraguei]
MPHSDRGASPFPGNVCLFCLVIIQAPKMDLLKFRLSTPDAFLLHNITIVTSVTCGVEHYCSGARRLRSWGLYTRWR